MAGRHSVPQSISRPGIVSALTGLGNNTNQLQITASNHSFDSARFKWQPVLNKKAEIIGVVSMKLSDAKMVKATGQVAQSVNFAVSGQTLKSFLDTRKVEYAPPSEVVKFPEACDTSASRSRLSAI